MQRRTKKDLELLAGETLLDYFIRHTLTEKDEKNVVQVLAHMNAFVFGQTERKRKEIEDFGDYFLSNGLEESSRDERIKYFGEEDAYILNIYYKLFEEEERKRILEEIEDISLEQRYEAMTLTDTIFSQIKEDITVTLSTLGGPVIFNYYKNDAKNTEMLKNEFFIYMAYAIKLGKAGLVVRIKKKPKDLLFGIKIEDEKWEPLRVYEFLEDYEDGLDLSVMYTEISRKYE
ncbi:hypothetical protein SAMN02746066_04339 [Anaerosporobacter mobilis DSM 15930]|uniref:Uncharacterized protein n=1 Tax=Anaerosporobacter mobilis DSM 15930 TaxID=1120996 RepID=A0A1M7NAP2_9FIRM|nr:hypothetical protein [Anaerosporobacter mobilis]SHN00582.1 hypothetical protein SAMN02746066_04339 [Anaerosporobacter mobilis DSM 15930]